jgi:hypothetical protein
MKKYVEEVDTSDFPQLSGVDSHHTTSLEEKRKRYSVVNREIKEKQ